MYSVEQKRTVDIQQLGGRRFVTVTN